MKKYIIPSVIMILTILIYTTNLGSVLIDIEQISGTNVIDGVEMNSVVSQEFISNKDKLCGIAVQFGTYARENEGYIRLELVDTKNNTIQRTKISKKNIIDNAYYEWYFPPIRYSSGKIYTLKIIDESTMKDNQITLYKDNNSYNNGYKLMRDDEIEEGTLNLITYFIK